MVFNSIVILERYESIKILPACRFNDIKRSTTKGEQLLFLNYIARSALNNYQQKLLKYILLVPYKFIVGQKGINCRNFWVMKWALYMNAIVHAVWLLLTGHYLKVHGTWFSSSSIPILDLCFKIKMALSNLNGLPQSIFAKSKGLLVHSLSTHYFLCPMKTF